MKTKNKDWDWFYKNRYDKCSKLNFVCNCGYVSTKFESEGNIPFRHLVRFGNVKNKTLDNCDNCKSSLSDQYFDRFRWQKMMKRSEKLMIQFSKETNEKMEPSNYLKWLEEQIYVT